jgi:hypothetical protein
MSLLILRNDGQRFRTLRQMSLPTLVNTVSVELSAILLLIPNNPTDVSTLLTLRNIWMDTDSDLSARCLCLPCGTPYLDDGASHSTGHSTRTLRQMSLLTLRNICTMGLAISLVTQFENSPSDVSAYLEE